MIGITEGLKGAACPTPTGGPMESSPSMNYCVSDFPLCHGQRPDRSNSREVGSRFSGFSLFRGRKHGGQQLELMAKLAQILLDREARLSPNPPREPSTPYLPTRPGVPKFPQPSDAIPSIEKHEPRRDNSPSSCSSSPRTVNCDSS